MRTHEPWRPRRARLPNRQLPLIPRSGMYSLTGRAVLQSRMKVLTPRSPRPWLQGVMYARARMRHKVV